MERIRRRHLGLGAAQHSRLLRPIAEAERAGARMSLTVASAPPFEGLPGIRFGFFGSRGGVSTGIYATLNGGQGSGDDPGAVAENRRRVADELAV